MKFLLLVLLWLIIFAGMYFILSLFGLLFVATYREIIGTVGWFTMYTLTLGWWIPTGCVVDFDDNYTHLF